MSTEKTAPDTETPPADAPAVADAPTPTLEEGMAAAMAEGLKLSGVETDPPAPAAGDDPAPAAADDALSQDDPAPSDTPADAPKDTPAEMDTLGIKNERARQRFTELSEKETRLTEIEATLPDLQTKAETYDQMLTHIQETGATPEQYGNVLGYLRVVNHGSPQELAVARETLLKEVEFIDQKLGRKDDPLADHADLQEAVNSGDLTKAYATEIANTRNLQAAQQRHAQQQGEQQAQASQQRQAELQQAVTDLNALGARLAADPLHAQKIEAAKAAFIARRDTIPPRLWAAEFLLDYNAVVVPQAPAAPARPAVSAVPLRPQGGSGGLAKVAGSMEEAIQLGLQAHARAAGGA